MKASPDRATALVTPAERCASELRAAESRAESRGPRAQSPSARACFRTDSIPVALSTWLDGWVRATLDVLRADAVAERLAHVEDAHRAAALWRYVRHTSHAADASQFARGVHPVLTIAETRDRGRLLLDAPTWTGEVGAVLWRVVVRVGAPGQAPSSGSGNGNGNGLVSVEVDGECQELRLASAESLIVPAHARVLVPGGMAPTRWVAMGLLTGHTIAL